MLVHFGFLKSSLTFSEMTSWKFCSWRKMRDKFWGRITAQYLQSFEWFLVWTLLEDSITDSTRLLRLWCHVTNLNKSWRRVQLQYASAIQTNGGKSSHESCITDQGSMFHSCCVYRSSIQISIMTVRTISGSKNLDFVKKKMMNWVPCHTISWHCSQKGLHPMFAAHSSLRTDMSIRGVWIHWVKWHQPLVL